MLSPSTLRWATPSRSCGRRCASHTHQRQSRPGPFTLMVAIWLLLHAHSLCAADAPQASHASQASYAPQVAPVRAEIIDRKIVASAELLWGFQPDILRDLHNGIPKDFYYYFVVNRKYKNWIDEEVYEKTVRHAVRYDTLKKQYTVTQNDSEHHREETYDDLESARRAVLRVSDVALMSVDQLRPDRRYYVGVKAQMKAARLPVYQEYFLFFIPFLEIDTPWTYSDVIHGIP